jgi:hypothetical protein
MQKSGLTEVMINLRRQIHQKAEFGTLDDTGCLDSEQFGLAAKRTGKYQTHSISS